MASTTPSPLLALPPELRDLVYQHALEETLPWPTAYKEQGNNVSRPLALQAPIASHAVQTHANDTQRLLFRFPAHAPRPAWYNILLCCRTTNQDIRQLVPATTTSSSLKPKSNLPPAIIDLTITSTSATATWQHLPCHPHHISDLHVHIRLSHLWDPDLLSGAPQADNKILRALFSLLRHFCRRGPHLSRLHDLSDSLTLETVILTVEASSAAEESEDVGRSLAAQQLATVSGVFAIWLSRFVGSCCVLSGRVGELRWDCRCLAEMGGKPVVFVVVEDHHHDHHLHGQHRHRGEWADCQTFRDLGYSWD